MNSPLVNELNTVVNLVYLSIKLLAVIGVLEALKLILRGFKKWRNLKEKIAEDIGTRILIIY